MKQFYTTLFCLLTMISLHAQEKTVQFTIDDGYKIQDYDVTDTGNFFILENGHAEDKTRLTLLDNDLNEVYRFRGKDKIAGGDLIAMSQTGKNSIFRYSGILRDKNFYRIHESELSGFSEKDPNGNLEDDFYFRPRIYALGDRIQFLNDREFVAIGKKEGASKKDKDVYLYVKSLAGDYENQTKLDLPGEAEFKRPKLLYFDNEVFIVGLTNKAENTSRKYLCVTYDYRGNIRNEARLDFEVNDKKKEEFAELHLNRYSFSSYQPTDINGDKRTIFAYQLPTEDAKGAVVYDKTEKVYYAYAGIKPERGDSGFLVCKYDQAGNLIWKKYREVPGTDFRYVNSFNRYFTFDVTPHFLGISTYSTKGKSYCNFYLLNKENGQVMNSKIFGNYKLQVNGNKYAGLYSKFSSGDKGYKNVIFDRFTVFSSLYNRDFSSFIHTIDTKTLLKSYPTAYGTNVISVERKARTLTFQKFTY
ncbi:hypothetical protein [Sinomicrobium sp. M5D2P9]